jgi:hypothetical protein
MVIPYSSDIFYCILSKYQLATVWSLTQKSEKHCYGSAATKALGKFGGFGMQHSYHSVCLGRGRSGSF